MNESILEDVKKMLGIPEEYDHFDQDLIIHINSVFSVLTQLGIGPNEGFHITGGDETWSQFVGDARKYDSVRSYVYLRTRLLFDPPTSSPLIEVVNRQIAELEWRLNVNAETSDLSSSGGGAS